MITAKGDNLVFLLGVPRSGTTLLSVMLNNHPAVRCPPEPWVMLALESLGRTSAHDPCDAPVLQKAFTRFLDPSAAMGFARKFAVSAYNRALESDKKILVDKTPRYYLILPYLIQMFPHARFIILWRDPLDVAASMKETWDFDVARWFAEGQDHSACIDLIVGLRRIFDFGKSLKSDQCRSVQYEELVRDPRGVMSGLFEWLGVPAADTDEPFALSGGEFERSPYGDRKILTTTEPHEKSVGKWQAVFDTQQATLIASRIGQPLIAAMGYAETAKLCVTDRHSESEFRRLEECIASRRNEYAAVDSYSALCIEEQRIRKALVNGHANAGAHSNGDFLSLFRGLGDRVSRISEIDEARRLSEDTALSLQAELRRRDAEIAQLRTQFDAAEADRMRLGGHAASLENRLAEEQDRNQALLDETAETAARLAAVSRDLISREDQLQGLKIELEAGKLDLDATRVELDATRVERDAAKNEVNAGIMELDAARRIQAELRSTMGVLQDSLHGRVEEVGALLAKLNEAALLRSDLQKEINLQRTAANRYAMNWERAHRSLTQIQAASYHRTTELESQLRTLREDLIRERSISAELGKKIDHERQQAVSDLAARDQAIDVLTKATRELNTRLRMLLTSRFMRFGWKLGFGSVPYWDDPARDELTGVIETTLKQVSPPANAIEAHPDEMDRALQHLVAKGLRPKVVLDIGAAKGYWTRNAAWRWPDAEFFMIDPLAESEESLRDICRNERFHYCLTAVGKEPGELVINLTPDCDGSSLLEFPNPNPDRQRRVPVATIDELLNTGKLKPPELVKIDVQGFEIQVMDGGKRMFETAEVFILEVSLFRFMAECPRVDEIVRYMADRQFFLFDVAGLLRRPFENDLGQMDLVFVSARSPLAASNRWS